MNAISLLEEVFVTSVLKQQISQLALYTAGTQSFTISQVIVIQAVPGINEMTYCKKKKGTSLQHRLGAVAGLLFFQTCLLFFQTSNIIRKSGSIKQFILFWNSLMPCVIHPTNEFLSQILGAAVPLHDL